MAKKIEIKGKTKEAYDHVGAEYDSWYWTKGSVKLRERLKGRVLSVIREISKEKKKPKILDVCCGTGYLVEELSKLGDYTGVDFSTVMVDVCKRRHSKNRFIVGDAENLPFKKGSFDVVVCFWSFHHIIYPEKALDEFSRILKKNGMLIIATFKDTKFNPLAKLGDIISGGYYGFQTYRYSKKEMKNLLAKRFKNFEVEIFPKSKFSPSFWTQIGIRFLVAKATK